MMDTSKSAYALYEGQESTVNILKVKHFQEKEHKVNDSKY